MGLFVKAPARLGGLCVAVALAAIGLQPIAGPQPADAAMRPLKTGVSYVYDNEPAAFEQVVAAGAQLALTPVRWGQIAPKHEPGSWDPENPSDPHYDWEQLDVWVTNAVHAGLTPILQLRGAPLWAQHCPEPTQTDAPCKPDPAALAQFATAAARRYSGHFEGLPRVRYWQGLNEPNLSLFFNPQYENGKPVSPYLYRELINSFYFAVKAVDRSNIVLAAGLGPIAVPPLTIGPMRFARLLLCMAGSRHPHPTKGNCGGGVHFDVFDIHPYTTGSPTHQGHANDVELGDLPKLQRLLAAADRAGRIKGRFRHTPLWITEFGWDSRPPDPGGLPMRIETRWTAEALYRAWSAGVNHFFWYSLRDFPPEPNLPFSETLQTGLYFRGATVEQDQPKELMYAFRFPFVAYPRRRGLFVWGRTPGSSPGRVAIQVQRGKRWRDVLAVRADRHGMFAGFARTGYGRHRRGAARAVYRGERSKAFSMRPVPDFYQPPFG
ncbi:MAG TPA: hypothetical protein VFP23_01335 [Solirubrobacterales bacterium]|nr:hypothetical protein [Solirubrobacterales bacterium]